MHQEKGVNLDDTIFPLFFLIFLFNLCTWCFISPICAMGVQKYF